MNKEKSLKNRILGWIPKDSIRLSAQTSRTVSVFLIVLMAALIVPIFYLVIHATNYLGIFWPITYLVIVLVLRYILHKTGIDKTLSASSQSGVFGKVRRVQIVVGSGLLVAFGTVFAARLIIGPLSLYFLIPFILLAIVGALIGDSIWKAFQKRSLKDDSKWP
ncbi:MAG: hypothetical protein NWF04_01705 [Candidatus Bathyarchaeota archaeon]|nr:hypothetical protein [Candidatus Bathyarchaeota archaeon]